MNTSERTNGQHVNAGRHMSEKGDDEPRSTSKNRIMSSPLKGLVRSCLSVDSLNALNRLRHRSWWLCEVGAPDPNSNFFTVFFEERRAGEVLRVVRRIEREVGQGTALTAFLWVVLYCTRIT